MQEEVNDIANEQQEEAAVESSGGHAIEATPGEIVVAGSDEMTVVGEALEEQATEDTVVEPQEDKPSRKELREESQRENVKALRESRKQLQKERDDYLLRIKQLEDAQVAAQKAKNLDAYDTSEFDDNAVDSGMKKNMEEIRQMRSEMASNNSRMKLGTNYPDFTKVVNEESIAILKQRFPEVAATLDQSRDIYTTGVSAYNIIKKFGLHIDEEYVQQRAKVEANVNKPRPASSVKGQSALVHASDYSDLSDKKVRDEIIRIATERAEG